MTLGFAILCLAVLVGTISACVLGVLLYHAFVQWYWDRRLQRALRNIPRLSEPQRRKVIQFVKEQ